MNVCIVNGSSRFNGNTGIITERIASSLNGDEFHLANYNIEAYRYDHQYQHRDFYALMSDLVSYDLIILATPVYWYAMSGLMKNFLDRITDCLKTHKELGRQLRGKSLAAVSCGSESTEVLGYFEPFRLSADYLGMYYLGHIHSWIDSSEPSHEVSHLVTTFCHKLKDQYDKNDR